MEINNEELIVQERDDTIPFFLFVFEGVNRDTHLSEARNNNPVKLF